MTPVDDLKIGDCIAVVGCKRLPTNAWGTVIEGEYHGRPFKILEISLPFLCVIQDGKVAAIDVRQWEVKRVSKKYAQLMWATSVEAVTLTKRKKRRKKTKPDPKDCPRCGCKMDEVRRPDMNAWHMVCPECRWDGGPVLSKGLLS